MFRRASVRAIVVVGTSLSFMALPAWAVPTSVSELYDPSVVRDLQLEMLPLSGWESFEVPTDCSVDALKIEDTTEAEPNDLDDTASSDDLASQSTDDLASEPSQSEQASEGQSGETSPIESSPEMMETDHCWATMTLAERDAYVAADPDLRAEAVQAAWDKIRFDTSNSIVLPAIFAEVINGEPQPAMTVGVRRKSSRALPSEADPRKIGMKVRFGDFVKGQTWRGVNQLSLENGGDVSPLFEGMAWRLHQSASIDGLYGAGYDPALAAWATVSMNGEHLGVFTSVEQRNKQFLRNHGLWKSGSTWMYEQDDIGLPELDEGPDPLPDGTVVHSPTYDRLCFQPFRSATGEGAATCATPTDGLLDDELNASIDMQPFLTQAAVDAFTVNDDALLTKGKNYLFVDRTNELRRYYPWDLDAVFRAGSSNIYSIGSTTNRRGTVTYNQSTWQQLILNHPTFRTQFNETMLALINGPLSAPSVDAMMKQFAPSLERALENDPYFAAVASGTPSEHIAALQAWITAREAEVRRQVAANLPAPRKADSSAPSISAPALSSSTVAPGAEVTLSATITDNAEITTVELRVGSGTWSPVTTVDGSLGGTREDVATSFTAPFSDGDYDICLRATDSSANTGSACARLQVTTPKVSTTLAYTGALEVKVGATVPMAARLTTTSGSTPLAGRTVSFTLNKVTYTAVTDGGGVASVSGKALTKAGSYTVSASWSGASGLSGSTTSVTLKVTR